MTRDAMALGGAPARAHDAGMTGDERNHVNDLRGASRLAIDATAAVADLVEALHRRIARTPTAVGGPVVGATVEGVTDLVYQSIRGVTRVVGAGVDRVLAELAPLIREGEPTPQGQAVLAALDGLLGDYLADTGNPLAITMRLRRDGVPVELTPAGLAWLAGSKRLVVLAHGLCMNDLQWLRDGHDLGAALERDLGCARVYLHYNTGRHVSTNGRALAALLEELTACCPVEELLIVGHSMGGLVARSAFHYGSLAAHGWTRSLRKLVFLGTPHHGAPYERGGNWLQWVLGASGYTEPFARLGRLRSAGITDLRHGSLVDEDWEGRDRFEQGEDPRVPLALPAGVECYAVAATIGVTQGVIAEHLLADGLVPLASALGRHEDPRRALAFPEDHTWVATNTGHLEILWRPEVYEKIRDWLR
jgi:pimeloyl-ACP methyl ester carboxylesterase